MRDMRENGESKKIFFSFKVYSSIPAGKLIFCFDYLAHLLIMDCEHLQFV